MSYIDTERTPRLPPEIIQGIVTIVLMDYIDDIIPSPDMIRSFTLDRPPPEGATLQVLYQMVADQLEANGASSFDIGPFERNHFAPLLQTSWQVREIALLVLSIVFKIPRVPSSGCLAEKPWPYLNDVIKLYVNPKHNQQCLNNCRSDILKQYCVIASLEWETHFHRTVGLAETYPWVTSFLLSVSIVRSTEDQMVSNPGLRSRAILCFTYCVLADLLEGKSITSLKLALNQYSEEMKYISSLTNIFSERIENLRAHMNTTWAHLMVICKSLYGQDSVLAQFWDLSRPRFPSQVLREIERVLDPSELRPMFLDILQEARQDLQDDDFRRLAQKILDGAQLFPWKL